MRLNSPGMAVAKFFSPSDWYGRGCGRGCDGDGDGDGEGEGEGEGEGGTSTVNCSLVMFIVLVSGLSELQGGPLESGPRQ